MRLNICLYLHTHLSILFVCLKTHSQLLNNEGQEKQCSDC